MFHGTGITTDFADGPTLVIQSVRAVKEYIRLTGMTHVRTSPLPAVEREA
jgi:hypothetical protein